jgi:hypothetical protein
MYDFGIRQAISGYRIAYRPLEPNHCPGCGKAHWIIGRTTAECAFCATALPLIAGGCAGIGTLRSRQAVEQASLAA